MTRSAYLYCLLLTALTLTGFMSGSGIAQNRFSPAIQVNDRVITRFDLDQRTRFLALLNAPGDPRELAREQLITEAIQLDEAKRLGVLPAEDEVRAGLDEFAGRANLTADEFTAALAQGGVSAETFRDFITAGVAWRTVVQGLFRSEAGNLPQKSVDRAFAERGTSGGLRVLVSELLLPATSPETTRASRARASELYSTLSGETEFAAAVRQYSVAASRATGGALNWAPLDTLPPEIQTEIRRLTPGQISRPIETGNIIALFLLRDIERVESGRGNSDSVEYALFITGPDSENAKDIEENVDTCDDLYRFAQDLPEDRLIRDRSNLTALPDDIRAALATLDTGEATTAIQRNGRATVLMLCSRAPDLANSVDIEMVRNGLANARLSARAANYLAELRARAYVADLSN